MWFEDDDWNVQLSYIVDILAELNKLNKSLQGTNTDILTEMDKVSEFKSKLNIFIQKIESDNFLWLENFANELKRRENNNCDAVK